MTKGFCAECGWPFDCGPPLRPGQSLGRYTVIGPFAHGGVGWVYLAEDTHQPGEPVVLKGLIDPRDRHAVKSAVDERRYLTLLDHPNIVRALDFVTGDDAKGGEAAGFLVMKFAGGSSLRTVMRDSIRGVRPLLLENVIGYGLEILRALQYLHELGLLYCDLKPENVVHGGKRVRLIDLGAVRQIKSKEATWGTDGYQVPEAERKKRGLTIDSDLYTVGRTLTELFRACTDNPRRAGADASLAASVKSFEMIAERAAQEDWHRRFRSAAEMTEQLTLVQREVVALRVPTGNPRLQMPLVSTQFAPSTALFDSGLGAVPPLEYWATGAVGGRGALADGRPSPALVAGRLPDPLPDPDDPATASLAAVSASDPQRLLTQLSAVADAAGGKAVEVELWRCRAYLALAAEGGADSAHADAEAALDAAALIARDQGRRSWRIAWHRGLLKLATAQNRGHVAAAAKLFGEVWAELPGEVGPKLALGFCAEYCDHPVDAERNYQAVWRADDMQASAAFGLVRLRLAALNRPGAVALLDEVPALSRHYDAARIAAVRVLAGRLGPADAPDPGAPGPSELDDAAQRLDKLGREGGVSGTARDRLATIVLEAALEWSGAPAPAPAPADWSQAAIGWFGDPVTENGLRERLCASLRQLARNAASTSQHGTLIDLANAVRPWTRV